ncbi:hypothetical protein [Phenylobacterium sp.]|uniref:hypothetical protein n=1 Tax=Phenylobacterium sp. TaxID=1871053 RepID=UPI002F9396BF
MENELIPTTERVPANRPAAARSDIPGWGVDADRRNDATYPMRDRDADDSPGMNWERPTQQTSDVEILQSVEHNRRPAVFGVSTPPSGLSGVIRRTAFGYSESQWAHWLLLMLADRINEAEGVLGDLAQGKVPNLVEEMGLAAEWKYNREAYVRKVATGVVVAGSIAGLGYLLLRRSRRTQVTLATD